MKGNKTWLYVASLALGLAGCGGNSLPEWETFQGNSAHTGYVPVSLDVNKFTERWQMDIPDREPDLYLNPAVTGKGLVYVSDDGYFDNQSLYALRESDGSIAWRYDFGAVSQLNQPAYNRGKVFVTTSGHDDTFLWIFDAVSGELLAKTPFATQWPRYLAPTVLNNVVYTNTGYYGGQTSAFSALDGRLLWESTAYGDNDMFTPAVDGLYVYHYSGTALNVLSVADGSLVKTIDDVATGPYDRYSHIGSTVLGSLNNVVSFSGDDFSGLASSSAGGYNARPLSSYDLAANTVAWISTSEYKTHPALVDGLVFAGSESPLRLEALDEASGNVVWTWVPQDAGITGFHRNVVATKNLVFISSNKAVHAISRLTHEEVWSYPRPGTLSISPGKVLYIAGGFRVSDGSLTAISLQ